ncbi:helix-turn-helix domain-containing protein [Salinibacterium sp. NSLL150]|uniref:helix-turn-helix domain-containing protein n=1 Tax=unclassified Salinibacterium TaxID=2632331 RepID=UPI0018CEA573|nr:MULTISPECIES: helix-turn-helix domain-containing protein [unclassified Salinibacterium]MBH0098072.1 helix-turn-helix domain-containing protein [Salinibacterium sp. NSLL35]MBH0100827.1 helix-turn-helix domain-containing protein [Salinibacterium sp. NSLL150]MBH0103586.1 helix-turn-helix domain-containing protein [Salinibacterium sp. NSLL16]MBH0106347.1 helix-turn-helix domain-containing protein [Salinibacterium sp. NSLL17]
MNETRIVDLRRERGWTQEKLATECGVGIRTIQRLEAGSDASLETLSLVADALGVPVRDLFASIESDELSGRVDSFESRAQDQQSSRKRVAGAWVWLFVGVGVVISMFSFAINTQLSSMGFVAYWLGGSLIFIALKRLVLEPYLQRTFPLSRSKGDRRLQKSREI